MNVNDLVSETSRQRINRLALERAEDEIALECVGCAVVCKVDGAERRADLYNASGLLVASFRARTWPEVVGAARGWAGVSE